MNVQTSSVFVRRFDERPPRVLNTFEFVALAAAMMAMLAFSIDVMLPALAVMGSDLGVEQANHNQYVVSYLIFGMSVGQLIFGPLADSLGRKPAILIGLAVFGVGCVASLLATNLETMLSGRILQGLGAAGPRIVTLALVRDQFSGHEMARVMSLVIAVLMVGPLVAPFVGQGILLVTSWRSLFVVLLVADLVILVWFAARQPETLPAAARMPFSRRAVTSAVREVFGSRVAIGYALAAGVVFGELFAYVNSARQIYQDVYGVARWFPFCFSLSGIAIAVASLVNARLVSRIGMRSLCVRSGLAMLILAIVFLAATYIYVGIPPLPVTLGFMASIFFCAGILFGNLNALAMEPLGNVAGVAAGVVGSLSWFLAVVIATAIGQLFDGTVVPLAAGFLILSLLLLLSIRWAEAGRGTLV